MEESQSKSGSPVYTYQESDKKQPEAAGGQSSLDEISEHIEKHVGEIHKVFHELVSEQVHIDIHWVKPTKERPFHTLVTSGMSDKPMNSPEGMQDSQYAELSICLPENWKVSEKDFENENNYWPIRWLKVLSRFPHEYNTWLNFGHTVPNGDPAVPFSKNTKLSAMVLLPSVVFTEDFHTLHLPNKKIDFFTLIPLYSEEVKLKMRKGVEALYDGFDKHGVSDVLDVNRPNIAKRKILGLF